MTEKSEGGFTIVEVMIAIVMLSIGVLALASSSGSVTRMMNFGRQRTNAIAIGQSVLDSLRVAAATPTKCTALTNGSHGTPAKVGFTTSWTVATDADSRNVTVTVGYQVGPQSKTETVTTSIFCL